MEVHSLDDGVAVWLDPMRDVKSVALGVYVAGGSADEAKERLGATHFLEHLLFKRSRRRSGAAIARTTDRLGGDCDAYTTKEVVAFHARTTAERAGDALELLLDLTEAPAFTAEDVEVERKVILEEMAEANDVPEDRLHDELVRKIWRSHPLGAPILGTEESVSSLTRASLAARFREIFVPERTVVVAVGAIDPPRFLARLAALWKARRRRASRGASPLPPRGRRPTGRRCALYLARPDLTQSHVLVGGTTLAYGHRLVPAASLATIVLGGGVSSRLWRDVREKRGLAYHVGTSLTLHKSAGLSLIEAATAPKNLPKLVKTTGRVLARLLEDGVTKAELSRAKDQIRAEVALSLESTAARREAGARAFIYRGRPHEADEVIAEIDAVTGADVLEACRLLFGDRKALALGVSGPDVKGPSVDELHEELAA